MYKLFEIRKIDDILDYVPEEKREWWMLKAEAKDKQELLDWHRKHKMSHYSYKIVGTKYKLKDNFFPRTEVRRRTETAKFLKQQGY